MGVGPEVESAPLPQKEARRAALEALGVAKEALQSSLGSEQARRGILAYDGASLAGEYSLGPWRISPAPDSASSSLTSEKILLCDRMVKGRDWNDINLRFGIRSSSCPFYLRSSGCDTFARFLASIVGRSNHMRKTGSSGLRTNLHSSVMRQTHCRRGRFRR